MFTKSQGVYIFLLSNLGFLISIVTDFNMSICDIFKKKSETLFNVKES